MSPKGTGFVMPADEELATGLGAAEAEVSDVAESEVTPVVPASPPAPPTTSPPAETKTQSQAKAKPQRINYQDDPDFRKVQASWDQQIARERQRASEAEARLRALEEQQMMAQDMALQSRLADVDPEISQALQQKAALDAQRVVRQIRQWEQYKQKRIKEEGFDPSDERFAKDYRGMEGTMQFHTDLLEAKRDQLQEQLKEAQRAASPDSIAKLVQAEIAKALAGQGYDANDLGGSGSAPRDEEAYQADLRKFQMGAMSPARFHKKWGQEQG